MVSLDLQARRLERAVVAGDPEAFAGWALALLRAEGAAADGIRGLLTLADNRLRFLDKLLQKPRWRGPRGTLQRTQRAREFRLLGDLTDALAGRDADPSAVAEAARLAARLEVLLAAGDKLARARGAVKRCHPGVWWTVGVRRTTRYRAYWLGCAVCDGTEGRWISRKDMPEDARELLGELDEGGDE